uniref:Hepcidin n=1 Tax=Acanthochromis polyacanthus TaxID=80966 RepID=A0A3Q1EZ86_9TELE
MKTFSVAAALAVMLTFIYIQESSAVPVSEEQVLEEPVSPEHPAAAHEETTVDSWKMLYNSRNKPGIHCHFCYGCYTSGLCKFCCRF